MPEKCMLSLIIFRKNISFWPSFKSSGRLIFLVQKNLQQLLLISLNGVFLVFEFLIRLVLWLPLFSLLSFFLSWFITDLTYMFSPLLNEPHGSQARREGRREKGRKEGQKDGRKVVVHFVTHIRHMF